MPWKLTWKLPWERPITSAEAVFTEACTEAVEAMQSSLGAVEAPRHSLELVEVNYNRWECVEANGIKSYFSEASMESSTEHVYGTFH